MKIAHIVSTFPPYKGGMGNSVNNFALSLSRLGENVTVITPDYGTMAVKFSLEKKEENISNGEFKVLRLKPVFKSGNAAFLPQAFFKLADFEIVHLHYPFYGVACLVLLKKIISGNKMKLVVHYHMDTSARGFKGLIFKLNRMVILPRLMRYADRIICSSLDYAQSSHAGPYYDKYKNKFVVVPFGVDLERFSPDEEIREPSQIKYILFVGGLDKAHYFKGLEVLMKAIAKISYDGFFLSIVGSGDMHGYYEKLADSLGIGGRVKFFGRAGDAELANYYRQSDCLVLPSINTGEAFGLVLLEAMATGKPVIASDLPGVRSVFTDGKEGFFIKSGDETDLAEKIQTILGDDKLAEKMGHAGRKTAEEKYSWENSAKSLIKIYNNI